MSVCEARFNSAWAHTLQLEKLGLVQPDPELHERMDKLGVVAKKGSGRPRVYRSETAKKQAYRSRQAAKVTDIENA